MGEHRFMEDLLMQRDSKMRRFCNYFVTLFNQKKINPFTQFIQQAKLKEVKSKVREKMDAYTNGEIIKAPVDQDPPKKKDKKKKEHLATQGDEERKSDLMIKENRDGEFE